jgi:hypothetical protein
MKLLSKKEFNKIAKTALAMTIAGSITLSSTYAFASENTDQYKTVEMPNVNSNETVQTESKDLDTATANVTAEKPSLLPGDFFYFVKVTIEKIKLALTLDDKEEAKLLAEFSAERLAEAEALLADGKEKEAIELIQKSASHLTNAEDIIDENKSDDSSKENEEISQEDSNKQTDETANKQTDENTEESADLDEKEASIEPFDEVEDLLSQNIIALKHAMEKVKNPKAKAALQKNIDKSYAKLAKKIEKIEKKYADKEKTKAKKSSAEETQSAADANDSAKIEEKQPVGPPVKEDTKKEQDKKDLKAFEKAAKEAEKANAKEVKEAAKQAAEAKRAEAKAERDAAKEEAKAKREAAKEAAKTKHEEAKVKHEEAVQAHKAKKQEQKHAKHENKNNQ